MTKTKKQTTPKTTPTAKKAAGASDTQASAPATSIQETPAADEMIEAQPEDTATDTFTEETDKQPEETPADAPVPDAPIPDAPASSETPAGDENDPEPETILEIPTVFGITEQTVIVIAAEGEAAEILLRTWHKTAAPADIRIVAPAATLAETFESLVADDLIPAEFIFVPGICIPTAKLTLADLALYRRRMLPKGETADYTGLPMHLTKENIVDALKNFQADPEQTDELLVRSYNAVAHKGELPNQVAFSFGNGVGYVTRADFCPAVLIEFLLRRKFVCLAPEAFPAAKRYLEEYAR